MRERGIMQNDAPAIYTYSNLSALLEDLPAGEHNTPLPGAEGTPVTERPTPK
jgi:hypothetical protein